MLRIIAVLVALSLSTMALGSSDTGQHLGPAASIEGTSALWQNPAGLAFMGGLETTWQYLYEWGRLGHHNHFTTNLAMSLGSVATLAGGIHAQVPINAVAKNQGGKLSGIFGTAFKLTKNSSFGMSFYKSHAFLNNKSSPTLISFGTQVRVFNFLSLGGVYQEVSPGFFSASDITLGLSFRPITELTFSVDNRFKAMSVRWQGFRSDPIFSIKGEYHGLALALACELPGLFKGVAKPVFAINLEANLAHVGLGLKSFINSAENNFMLGTSIRASTDEWPAVASPNGLWVELTINADGTLETAPSSFAMRFFAAAKNPLSVLALLRRIENDKSIAGLKLNLKGFGFGDASTQEWRAALLALRKAKKTVVVYLDSPSERDYYVASAANKILMNKQSTISLSGFLATLVYFADMLEKFGIKADAVVAGSYKNAPKRWTSAKPDKAELEIASNILNNFYETMLNDVSRERNIDKSKLSALFDLGEISAFEAHEAGLVDELAASSAQDDQVVFANYEERRFKQVAWHGPKKIAVIEISNTIVDGRVAPGLFSLFTPNCGAEDVIDEIEDAVLDPDVAGLIIRINSPGGDAEAGHKIQQALLKAQASKPVITSMSDVAASAGYLIASGTSHILAQPNTITGSIGVFSLMFSGEKLSSKLGMNLQELSPIKNPGPTMWRSLSVGEKQQAQKIVDWYYQNFIEAVSEGLSMDKADVLERADGKVWLGHEALEKKLVHEIGGFMAAVDIMRGLAEVNPADDILLDIRFGTREPFSLSANLLGFLQRETLTLKPLKPLLSPYIKALDAYQLSQPQARLPFDITWQGKMGQ